MTALAPTLQAFFTDRLRQQRHASDETVRAYRDTWKLLVGFAAARTGKQPSSLDIDDIDSDLIWAAFCQVGRVKRRPQPSLGPPLR